MANEVGQSDPYSEVIELARIAGESALALRLGGIASLQIDRKEDGSPVTNADLASNGVLVPGLQRLFPGDTVFSEEGPTVDNVTRTGRVWFIDPLDGTSSYIAGNDDFSVLVGLCEEHKAIFGVMYFPAQGLMAWGRKGAGAWVNGRAALVSKSKSLRKGSVYHRGFRFTANDELLAARVDSGQAFLQLLQGEIDGMIMRLDTLGEHDFAAPAALLSEAGGRLSDEHGQAIRFAAYPNKLNYLVASNGQVHEELLKLVPR